MSAEMQKTILLVDDEAIIAMATKMTLEKYGYEVMIANTGEKAVETVEKTPAIDLILMDINLGAGIDGSETAVIILQKRDLPIVFLSGHTEPEVVAKTEKITSYGYVVKNSGDTVLQASIKMAFKLFASNEEMRKSKERQQLIMATLPIAIFTSPLDPEIDASWVSGDVEKVTGFTVDEYMAEKDFWRSRLHADDRERVLAAYKNPAAGDEIILEYRWLCKDGNYKWFYDRSIKKPNHHGVQYFGIILDITERKRAEEQILVANERLQYLLSSTSGVIYTAKPSGDFGATFISKNVVQMVGYNPEEFTRDSNFWFEHIHPEDQPIITEEVPKILEKEFHAYEYRFKCRDGRYIWVSDQMKLVRDNAGNPIEIIGFWMDISKRKQAEEDLRKNEKKYRGLTENINLGIYRNTVGPEGKFIEANPAIIGMFGHKSKEEFLAINVSDLYQNPEDRNKFNAKMLKQGFVRGEELWLKRKDGSFFVGSVSAAAVKDEQGQVKYYDGIIDNIDERKQAESQREAALEALQQSEALYQALIETSPDAIVLSDRNGTITMMNQQLATLHGHENKEELLGTCAFELFALEERQRAAENMGRAMEAGPGESRKFECVLLRKDGTRFWGELYGKLILSPNEKSPLMLTIVRDITERKQAESKREAALEAVRNSEEKYKGLTENINLGIYRNTVGPEGRFIEANPAIIGMFGYKSREEFLAVNVSDLYQNPEDRNKFNNKMLKKGVVRSEELWLKKKDGSLFVGSVSAVAVKDGQSQVKYYDGIIDNITERKQEEEELQKLASVVRHSSELINLSTPDGRMIFLNEAGSKMLGISPDEVNQTNIMQVIPAHLKDKVEKELLPALFNIGKWSGEMQYLNMKTGQLRDFLSTTFVIKEPGTEKTLYLANVSSDITERKRAESQAEDALEALRESEVRLKAQYQGMPMPTFIWQKKGEDFELIDFNDAAKVITHDKVIEFVGRKASDLYANRQDILRDLQQCYVERKIIKRETLSEHFVPGKLIALTIVSIHSDLVMVHMEDITERRRVEEKLQESEKRYRALVENASDIVFRTDKNGYFTFANPAVLHMTGYGEEELIGKLYLSLIRPDMRKNEYNLLLHQFAKGIHNTYSEFPILTKDGSEVWLGQNTQLITENGRITGFQAVSRDITERKRAEEEIKRQLAEKEILLKEVHHRIKNNIASIAGLISLHMQAATNPETIAVLQAANGRVNSMGILYDKLLLTEDYKDISVKNYLNELVDTIIAIFPVKAKIKFEKRIADFQLDPKRLFPLGCIINELLTNTMKYAFINRDAGLIKISLTNAAKHVTLTVQDNGSGLPDGFDINESKGFGLMLVKMLSQQLGGSFSIKKHEGTRCKIEFSI